MLQTKHFKAALVSACAFLLAQSPLVKAADTPAAQPSNQNQSQSNSDPRKEIEQLLAGFEHDWNAHNLDGVMSYYADNYVNNDGFDKKTIRSLTEDLWKSYPDIKSTSTTKQIRIEGPFATIESRDEATGNTATEFPGLGTRGELKSVSEGQLYMKHVGLHWRITGDRVEFEKIKIGWGAARQLEPIFAAPEQVKAGKQYSARVEVDLPVGLTASGSINQAPVVYPPPKLAERPSEKYRPFGDPLTEHPVVERVMTANTKNRNELLTATIALTNASGNSIMGVVQLTRRLNVIPIMTDDGSKDSKADDSATAAHKSNNDTPTGVE